MCVVKVNTAVINETDLQRTGDDSRFTLMQARKRTEGGEICLGCRGLMKAPSYTEGARYKGQIRHEGRCRCYLPINMSVLDENTYHLTSTLPPSPSPSLDIPPPVHPVLVCEYLCSLLLHIHF